MKRTGPVILAHGGAGARPMTLAQRDCLEAALIEGYDRLSQGTSALDAVEFVIRLLEVSGHFNAGVGARFQLDGVRRMDAALMEGRSLRAGAVAAIQDIRHPVTAARLVMERTAHVLLVGDPATRFARYFKLERQPKSRLRQKVSRVAMSRTAMARQTLALFRSMTRRERLGRETVGAVALDASGTVAAGASTGGIDLMIPGRVGDTPLIGCGVYADNQGGAVSMTGLGESIIRIAVAKEIVDRLAAGAGPAVSRLVLARLVARTQGAAGALVLTPKGRYAIRHTTPRMSAGYWEGKGRPAIKDQWR